MTSKSVSDDLAGVELRQSQHRLQCMLPKADLSQVLIGERNRALG